MKIQQYSAEHVQGEIDTAQLMLDNALMDIMMNDNETLSLEAAELFSIREHNKIVKGLHIDHSFKLGASEIFLKIQGISKALRALAK